MKGISILIFFGGVAVGAAGGILATKKHFQQIADEEIESVKEVFSARKESTEKTEDISIKNEKPALNDYMNRLKESGYKNYSTTEEENKIPVEPDFSSKDIYVISDMEFGEEDGYDQVSLTYFNDHVLCDEENEPLSQNDIIKTVGYDALENFDYGETDAVYVRNDILKTDYEILADLREYKNVLEDRR